MSTSEPAQRTVDEADEIEADWQQFQRLEQMVNHWDRPGWTDTRRSYHWMITLAAEPEVRTLAATCQVEFADVDTLDLVPLDYLHTTVQGVGFTDEVDRTTIDQLVATVQDRSASSKRSTSRSVPSQAPRERSGLRLRPMPLSEPYRR